MPEVYHFVRTGNMRYLTIKPPKQKTFFLSFDSKKTAKTCMNYIDTYKKKYGTWPNFDMDKENEIVQFDMDAMQVSEPLFVDKFNIHDVEDFMKRSNTGILHCYEFTVLPYKNTHTLNFRAQEMGLFEFDMEEYILNLESIIVQD